METKARILILARTPLWKACLQRGLDGSEISWALDVDSLLQEAAVKQPPTVVIELVQDGLEENCRKIFFGSVRCYRTRFFAVAGEDLRQWLPLIRVCGFVDCCSHVGALPKLIWQIRRNDQTCHLEELSIEEKVQIGLPWKSVRQSTHSIHAKND